MTESSFNLSEIKLSLKRKSLAAKKYKLLSSNPADVNKDYLTFLDIVNGTKVSGKVVRSSNERDHWPLLNHENVAPLFDVLNIRSDLKIYLTSNFQVKLKDIIHKEDFVYNSRCFDRKKAYAKGIFSGLSYIHGKSLCLMNLSDDNIYICNTHDKAVITNFSFISCSKKTTRDKMNVPAEHYKAPETEKHEFDAIVAEMWASGTLMLDLFLAHMVPWAVIDYKPRRVMEMVKGLSLDLLQAANAGSVVTVTDLVKFKAFLKNFFKDSQSRITAWFASISSFLVVKSPQKISSKRMLNHNRNYFPQQTEKFHLHSNSAKNPSKKIETIIRKRDTNLRSSLKHNNSNDRRSLNFDYAESCAEIYVDVETPTVYSGSNCTERDESFSTRGASSTLSLHDLNEENETVKSEINVKMNSTEIACDKQIQSDGIPYHGSEDKEDSFSTKIFLNKASKSCQMIKEETNELNYHQSKSLTFVKHDGVSFETPVKISCSKKYLCSSVRSLPVRRSNESDLKKSDFCLNRLFENKEWIEESMTEKKVSPKVPNTVNARNLLNSFEDFITYESKNQEISPRNIFKEPETRIPSRDSSPNSKMSIQRIKERFVALTKAEDSFKYHKSLFISEELADKQQSLINQHRDLLRQEKMRLCEVLSKEYKLSASEVKKLCKSFGSKSRCIKKYNRRSIAKELQFSSSEFSDCKLADKPESGKIAHRTINYNAHQKVKDSEDGLKLLPRKRLSHCKAIESSTNQECKFRDLGARKYPEGTEFILSGKKAKLLEAKNGQNTTNWKAKSARELQVTKSSNSHLLNQGLEDSVLVKLKDSKELLTTRKEKKKTKKDVETPLDIKKTKNTRKFCLNLCLGGKVEESASYDDLCEACKLGYGIY